MTDVVRLLEKQGWHVTKRRGGHLVARHPEARALMFMSSTPGDSRRWRQNVLALAERLLAT